MLITQISAAMQIFSVIQKTNLNIIDISKITFFQSGGDYLPLGLIRHCWVTLFKSYKRTSISSTFAFLSFQLYTQQVVTVRDNILFPGGRIEFTHIL